MFFYREDQHFVNYMQIEREEQLLAEKHIQPHHVVLELGARYGTVSYFINKNIRNPKNQVSVEPDSRIWNALERNKKLHNCDFNIVKGFVSRKKLGLENMDAYEGYGTNSKPDDNSQIPSYSLEQIEDKYDLSFNALVADCEGYLETFLDENPKLLDCLEFVMYERDGQSYCNYDKIEANLKEKGFYCAECVANLQYVWKKRKTTCFINSCTLENNNLYRLKHLLETLQSNNMYDFLDELYIFNIGNSINSSVLREILPNDREKTRFKIVNISSDKNLFEIPVLNLIQKYASDSRNSNANILYLHTKGVSYDKSLQTVNDWIDYMLYYLVERHEDCVEILNTTDIKTLGCNKSQSPHLHYSGNFWWSKSSYIKELDVITSNKKADAEWWLLSKNGLHKSLRDSNINHYEQVYPRKLYTSSEKPKLL